MGWAWNFLLGVSSDSLDKTAPCDPELSLTWHAGRSGGFHFAMQMLGQFPLGPENPTVLPDYVPALFSQRAFAFELRPLAGWSGRGWWIQAGLGARLRSHDMAGQIRYALAAGRAFGRLSGHAALDGLIPADMQGSGRPGDQERFYGYHLGGELRMHSALHAGVQLDSMIDTGQEMPLGARLNAYLRLAWR